MTIKQIRLTNFRQFERFTFHARKANILVGPNNCGKSTVLDALRILNDIFRYSRKSRVEPAQHADGAVYATLTVPHSYIGPTIANISTNYSKEPASIEVTHTNGNAIVISLSPDEAAKAYLRTNDSLPMTSSKFRKMFPIDLIVVPTLGPFEQKEEHVTDLTVGRNENTRLAHRSFRNIWLRKTREEFDRFSTLISETWPGVSLEFPEIYVDEKAFVEMFYIEDRITRELCWAGFGFQIWLQMMSQILRGGENSVLVLDEPDIYLHADLQRTLARIVRDRFAQYFLATHSTEIINECSAGDVVLISRRNATGRRIGTDEDYRRLFSILGSSENAEFSRIARAKRIVFFEGKDRRILRRLASRFLNSSTLDDPDTLYLQAGGFGQWHRVVHADWALEEIFRLDAKIVAIFDRDYRCDEEIDDFISKISSDRIFVYVLKRKEIENYALSESPLVRAIAVRVGERGFDLSDEQVLNILDDILTGFGADVQANIVASFTRFHRSRGSSMDEKDLVAIALKRFDELWSSRETRLSCVPGKEYISALSACLQKEFRSSITVAQIIGQFKKEEADPELIVLLGAIEQFLVEGSATGRKAIEVRPVGSGEQTCDRVQPRRRSTTPKFRWGPRGG